MHARRTARLQAAAHRRWTVPRVPAPDIVDADALICRYGSVARKVLGWYGTLTDDERSEMTRPLLAGLCNAVMLVPVLAEITDRPAAELLAEQVDLAVPPQRDRLLAWLEGTHNGCFG